MRRNMYIGISEEISRHVDGFQAGGTNKVDGFQAGRTNHFQRTTAQLIGSHLLKKFGYLSKQTKCYCF